MSRLFPAAALACAAVVASTALVAPAAAAPSAVVAVVVVKAHPVITISNFGFHGDLTVRPGATVTVKNKDKVTHTLTSKQAHLFNTGRIHRGTTTTFVAPKKAGRYPFGCKIHTEMKATLIVKPRH
jgi:plastocyanin